ncbi:MAG: hypothetical protein ABI740_09960, partial [Alphaproteobacteria bacterium]
ITLGGSLLASLLHGPIILAMLGLAAFGASTPTWSAGLLGAGYGSVLLASFATRRKPSLVALATLPFYWPLLSVAMLRAMWELKVRPHVWAKTPHGVSPSQQPPPPASLSEAAEARARAGLRGSNRPRESGEARKR